MLYGFFSKNTSHPLCKEVTYPYNIVSQTERRNLFLNLPCGEIREYIEMALSKLFFWAGFFFPLLTLKNKFIGDIEK